MSYLKEKMMNMRITVGEINVTIPIICQVRFELHFLIIGTLVLEISALILNKEGFLIFCMNRLSF